MTIGLNIKTALLLSFILRFLWLLLIDINPISDSSVYDDFAISITQGKGFAFANGSLTAFWPVGTSAIYAFIYSIFGHNYLYIGLLNLALGVGIVYFSWSIASHYFNEKVAITSAFILAIWPLLIQFTTVLASELPFVFMMLLIIWLINLKSINLITQAILFGIAIGLTCHIRPTIAPLLFILPIINAIKDKEFSRCIITILISVISCAIVITPWSCRNTALYGERTMLSTNFGPNLWMGNNPDSDGAYMRLPDREFASEKVRDTELKKEAINFIVNNPAQYLALAIKRMQHTFSRETIGIVWNEPTLSKQISERSIYYLKLMSTLFWYVALITGLIGVFLYLCRHRWAAIFFAPIVVTGYFISIPLLTVGQDRYHIPLIPFIAYFFAYTCCWLINYCKSRTADG